jgi:hypothetical protein
MAILAVAPRSRASDRLFPRASPGVLRMPHSSYSSGAFRSLSTVHANAMEAVLTSAGGPLTETEKLDFSNRIAENLMKDYNQGERDLGQLMRVALQGIIYRIRDAGVPTNPAIGGPHARRRRAMPSRA